MAIQETRSFPHWNYFLALEADLENIARYVEPASANFRTYSIEIARLILAAGSEVDVIAKELCTKYVPSVRARTIAEYRDVITKAVPQIVEFIVTVPRFGLKLNPWSSWRKSRSPEWWRAHNEVKHQRSRQFPKANLKNGLNAMAGLFLLELLYHRDVIQVQQLEPPPRLLLPPNEVAYVVFTVGGRTCLLYR